MNDLNRNLAPISDDGWKRLEAEARTELETRLAARKLVDFDGPHGWGHSAIDLGRVEMLEGDGTKLGTASVARRVVRPLIELRIPFEIERSELERIDRGAESVDLDPLRDAARSFAAAEDAALFEGYADADIPGILTDATNEGVVLPSESRALPHAVAEALAQLRSAGVSGPYGVAFGPETHAGLQRTSGPGGFPVLEHVQRLIDHPIVWAPTLEGGVVVSLRGGDFRFVCGRDSALGYDRHDDRVVRLFFEESFSAELVGAEAAVPLVLPEQATSDA